jgi:hypothetical protein
VASSNSNSNNNRHPVRLQLTSNIHIIRYPFPLLSKRRRVVDDQGRVIAVTSISSGWHVCIRINWMEKTSTAPGMAWQSATRILGHSSDNCIAAGKAITSTIRGSLGSP